MRSIALGGGLEAASFFSEASDVENQAAAPPFVVRCRSFGKDFNWCARRRMNGRGQEEVSVFTCLADFDFFSRMSIECDSVQFPSKQVNNYDSICYGLMERLRCRFPVNRGADSSNHGSEPSSRTEPSPSEPS